MKRILRITAAFLICILIPLSAAAKDSKDGVPSLDSISFNNAQINEEFKKDVFEYTLTLENPTVTPTLKSYKINGKANIYVTYDNNDSKQQTGINVTLEYENGSVYYKFAYSNADENQSSSNNLLADVQCRLGEVYPKINDSEKNYKLYIPSDLTDINLTVVTQDTGARFDIPKSIIISAEQEPSIALDVYAQNGDKRTYTFKVTRLKKTCTEIENEMKSPDFNSMVEGELFWQKPSFRIVVICTAAGLILILLFTKIAKRLTVKVEDEEEISFFTE